MMNERNKKTLELLLDELKQAGVNCGFISTNDAVWIRGPGSPWTDTPTLYTKAELDSAIASGKIRPQIMTGSGTWTYYVLA